MSSFRSGPLLVELFVEELPPKALNKLGEAFGAGLAQGLLKRGLLASDSAATTFATPRRLAAHLTRVAFSAPDRDLSIKLMPVSVALGIDGKPTDALRKRLAKEGQGELASLWPQAGEGADRLYVDGEGKAEAMYLRQLVPGASLHDGLQGALDEALALLPIPKVMQYQLADGWTTVHFVRPAHGLVALHGTDVVPVTVLGLESGRSTRGHRFEAPQPRIELRDASSYGEQLRDEGAVIASFAERRAEIAGQLERAAAKVGLTPIDDEGLLDEVTALVERPNVLACEFEAEFLSVPPECLILTMKANQRYFPLLDAKGALTNRFLVVSNVSPDDASRIVEGNERVVRPRLADAKFFFDQDRKKTLASRVPGLDKVVYHAKLGTQGDRVKRIRAIARWVAERIGADTGLADRAAELAKADLLTDMVGEFPELQGVMGGYYAEHDGEASDVVAAIKSQYVNRRSDADEDEAPNLVGAALLLADRIETLVGIWGVGSKPTGDKDPFALRRHALTVIHTFALLTAFDGTATHKLFLAELLQFAASTFAPVPLDPTTVEQVEDFIHERYSNQLATVFDIHAVGAVMALHPPLQEVASRLQAVRDFQRLSEAASLAAANKRVGNILKKSSDEASRHVRSALLVEPAEQALHASLLTVESVAGDTFDRRDYTASLKALAALKGPVDAFFDTVMVNADDLALRGNRLCLLLQLHAAMNRVADLSRLAT